MPLESNLLIPAGRAKLEGDLAVPFGALGLVIFAECGDVHRGTARNRFVARSLWERGFGTLVFDLLTPEEQRRDALGAHLRFDVPLLAARLGEVTDWALQHRNARGLRLAYFAESTGAAAALIAAARRPETVYAVVCRSGRPDLAEDLVEHVAAPTQLIVGSDDPAVLELNQEAYERLPGARQLTLVPGASHFFEEPGAIEEVSRIAGEWLAEHLSDVPRAWAPAH